MRRSVPLYPKRMPEKFENRGNVKRKRAKKATG
jgi:hypothetical protein